ncbi:MAG TPA: hypothetical protein VGG95_02105 [Edaphobacter sp.]|jgi:hypothetical protein
MASVDVLGKWKLTASANVTSQIAFDESNEPDPNGVGDWLNGFDEGLVSSATATSGMLLAIKEDGFFTERVTGTPNVNWFDVEGVLCEKVVPFDGAVVEGVERAYLCPVKIPSRAVPENGRYGEAVLRYDDGDTKIADSIHFMHEKLIRTINVVTDELYLDRTVLVYQRSSEPGSTDGTT